MHINRFGFFEKINTTAIYARISTRKQEQAQSVDSQVGMLIKYIEASPIKRLGRIYIDIGSGRNVDSRKELNRLLQDCHAGEVDAIEVKSIRRFGRNTVDVLKICRELKELGINVHFYEENIDSLDKNGELSLTICSSMTEGNPMQKVRV